MTGPTLSVIVVSRHRAAALARCLAGLRQQDHPKTEIIVIADPVGVAAVAGPGPGLKVAVFDKANISAARNAGLALAAGRVVAFIDDDAVPEPSWASRLVAPFSNASVVAATGFVRGRNGISYQWRASQIDCHGQDHNLDVPTDTTTLHTGTAQRTVKTQGTNCAFRASTLRQIGGFDPNFRFFLDEADVNLRLAAHGLTAIVPLAQVHHGFLASERRRGDRVPLSLFDIGASTAVFLRRHAPDALEQGLALMLAQQRKRALQHMITGRIEPGTVTRLIASLHHGWAEGMARPIAQLPPLAAMAPPFRPLPGLGPRPGLLLAGRSSGHDTMVKQAVRAVAAGQIVTVLSLSPGWRPHWHRFDPAGFWVQNGGLWGKSERTAPRPGMMQLQDRQRDEALRLEKFRPIRPDHPF